MLYINVCQKCLITKKKTNFCKEKKDSGFGSVWVPDNQHNKYQMESPKL